MSGFPPFIRALQVPDSNFDFEAFMVGNDRAITMFYETDHDLLVPEHSHGAQWGVVLDGEMEMVVDGVADRYRAGDTYYVPPGSPHLARLFAGCRGIDVFADFDRYSPRPDSKGPA
jgi:mannose-6-phosphate isomerase-like protein (cupin superfamily)